MQDNEYHRCASHLVEAERSFSSFKFYFVDSPWLLKLQHSLLKFSFDPMCRYGRVCGVQNMCYISITGEFLFSPVTYAEGDNILYSLPSVSKDTTTLSPTRCLVNEKDPIGRGDDGCGQV
ncbi:hypothetical protein E2542_SST11805 [Spatholobus suberectus]|nr:hypothetical protein E2542_SST11805 [Spatholobus suberectus]